MDPGQAESPQLAHTVRVDKPNLLFAKMLQQAIGGIEGARHEPVPVPGLELPRLNLEGAETKLQESAAAANGAVNAR